MIVIHHWGGLGNQMFQYATGYALAKRLNTELKIDISDYNVVTTEGVQRDYEMSIFNLSPPFASKKDLNKFFKPRRIIDSLLFFRYSQYIQKNYHYTEEINDIKNNTMIMGSWQSEKFFRDFSTEIRKELAFKEPLRNIHNDIISLINNTNSISLHIRRGDYISHEKYNKLIGPCSIQYYEKAINIASSKVNDPHFFVFSDDLEWVKENLRIDFPHNYISSNQGKYSYEDMYLMSLCKHNIISNSSFSWWGAWLNNNPEKIVIAPNPWMDGDLNSKDVVPETWIKIDKH